MRRLLLALVAAAAAGCSGGPRAPALTADAVYENDRAGLRFAVPDGWLMTMRTEPPDGHWPKPMRLVRYMPSNPEARADLELLAADVPDGTDVLAYLAENPFGSQKWANTPARELTINGATATRFESAAAGGKKQGYRREVTAFRRGGRVYFFKVVYDESDATTRDQVRRSVESVVWK